MAAEAQISAAAAGMSARGDDGGGRDAPQERLGWVAVEEAGAVARARAEAAAGLEVVATGSELHTARGGPVSDGGGGLWMDGGRRICGVHLEVSEKRWASE
jgi:hypothetical protein